MNKREFLNALRVRLSALNLNDIESSIEYYSEMIDDRIEDGLTEIEAVAAVGSVDEAAVKILGENPQINNMQNVPNKKEKKRYSAFEIVLLILGFPLWFSLLAAAFSVVLSVYIVIWAVVIVLYALTISLMLSALALFAMIFISLFSGKVLSALLFFGATLLLSGVGILLLMLSVFLTGKIAKLSVVIFKKLFIRGNR